MAMHRTSKSVPPELLETLRQKRKLVGSELPEAVLRSERLREAAAEDTLSGHLRKAIHKSQRQLDFIAQTAGIPVETLCDWLSGDRTLRSDDLDRLAQAVGVDVAVTVRPAS